MQIAFTAADIEPLIREIVEKMIHQVPPRADETLLLTQDEAARRLSISKRTLADLPDVPTMKIGKRRLYPVEGLKAWIRSQYEQSTPSLQSESNGRAA